MAQLTILRATARFRCKKQSKPLTKNTVWSPEKGGYIPMEILSGREVQMDTFTQAEYLSGTKMENFVGRVTLMTGAVHPAGEMGKSINRTVCAP
jgi:hypothetical protein